METYDSIMLFIAGNRHYGMHPLAVKSFLDGRDHRLLCGRDQLELAGV
jgi:hypothetical protein